MPAYPTGVIVARGGLPLERHLVLAIASALFILSAGCRTNAVTSGGDRSNVPTAVLSDVTEPDVVQWGKTGDGLQVGLLIRRKAARPFYDLICSFKNTGDHATWILKPDYYYGNDFKSSLEYTVNGQLYVPSGGGFFTNFPAAPTAECFIRLEPGQTVEGPVLQGLEDWRDVAAAGGPPEPSLPWQVDVIFVYRNTWPDLLVPVGKYGLWNRADGLNMFARLAPMWPGEARSGVIRVRVDQTPSPR